MVTALGHDEAKLWDLDDLSEPMVLVPMRDVFGVVMWTDFSDDGSKVAVGGIHAGARVFATGTGELLVSLEDPDGSDFHRGVAFNPDATRLVAASHCCENDPNSTPKIWDLDTGTVIHRLPHQARVWQVAWSPDGSTVATAGADDVRIWDPETGEERYTLNDASVLDLRFSPDGNQLVTAGESLKVWDVITGEELANFEGHTSWAAAVAWSPDGTQLVSGGMDALVKLWDVSTGLETQTLTEHSTGVWGVAWSADGTIASAGERGEVRLHLSDLGALERLARNRVTRSLTEEECRLYLHTDGCL